MTDIEPWWDDKSIEATKTQYIFYSKRDKVYYFSDETEQLNGPYNSEDEAVAALNSYSDYLNGPKGN